jgi:hypothetical protein
MASVRRAALAAVVGALVAAVSLVAAYVVHPGLTFEMDKPLPSFMTGMQGLERDALGTFSWTGSRVEANLPGIDRQVEWSCTVRLRGPRPEGVEHPTVRATVDGQTGEPIRVGPDYEEMGIIIPPAEGAGARVALDIAPTFRPGGSDRRELGVQVDRFLCRPADDLVRPPANAGARAAVAAAIFAAGLALIGLSLSSTLFAAVAVALGQTVMLALSSGIYGDLPLKLPFIAFWTIAPAVALSRGIEVFRREPLSSSARFVVAASASTLMLQLVGLLHPMKPIIDAQFNANRLARVVAGLTNGDTSLLFFTQPMPDGVQFPYAIGFYLFTAPWTLLTEDYRALVWTVACAADVVAGALLYPLVVRAWGDRRAAATAVVLYQLVPLSLTVLGNANLPNLFGQSLALAAMGAAVSWRLAPSRYGSLAGLTALVAAALCTHVSTVSTLPPLLVALAVFYWWRGDPERRRAAVAIAIAVAVAVLFAWLIYYRHFMDVYREAASRMFAGTVSTDLLTDTGLVKGEMSLGERLRDLGAQLVSSFGLPMLVLAVIGAWAIVRARVRDRLVPALAAWSVLWMVFSAATVAANVDREFIRYAAEYLGRINLATMPLVAILAAKGASLGWDAASPPGSRRALQIAAVVLMIWTFGIAVDEWIHWFRR